MSWIHHTAGPRGTRRHLIRRGVIVVCFGAVTLSGCVPAGSGDPVVPTPGSPGSAPESPTPSGTSPSGTTPSDSAVSSSPGTSLSDGGTDTPALPPGTVMPFRTVAPESASGIRIGLVAPAGSDAFGKAVTVSIITQVAAAGAELIRCDPGDDAALALDCARRMATQRVDGWMVMQPDGLGTALCDVGPQDVPLIVISGAPLGCQTASVGADDRRAGFVTGQALGRSARSHTACRHEAFVIVTDSAAPVSAARTEGIRAGFTAVCPGGITREILLDAGTQDRAYDSFSAALTALPTDAEVLAAAVNDGAALGVVAAIPDTRSEHVTVAAIGADQRARCEIMSDRHWIGDAALFPDRYGEVAVPALLDALGGGSIPGRMYIESAFVTATDIGALYDVTDCPGP